MKHCDIDQLAAWLVDSQKIVFFGGAGVSTESGIPDFRSQGGLYAQQREYGASPEEILSHHFFTRHPEIFYRFFKEKIVSLEARPNRAHRVLQELEKKKKLLGIITQNIDGLHQKAGSKNVLELHGSIWRVYCQNCQTPYTLDQLLSQTQEVPCCTLCQGLIRPDVVLYEESLPKGVLEKAAQWLSKADLLIIGGTSLSVYPAAALVRHFTGGKSVLINQSVTPYDQSVSLLCQEPIGQVLESAYRQAFEREERP